MLLAPVGLARGPVALSLLLIAAGLALGPATVSLFETLDVVAPGSGAESLTWVTTAEAGGTALGSAVAGPVVLHVGIWAPFAFASLLLVVPVGAVLGASQAGMASPPVIRSVMAVAVRSGAR